MAPIFVELPKSACFFKEKGTIAPKHIDLMFFFYHFSLFDIMQKKMMCNLNFFVVIFENPPIWRKIEVKLSLKLSLLGQNLTFFKHFFAMNSFCAKLSFDTINTKIGQKMVKSMGRTCGVLIRTLDSGAKSPGFES